MSKESPENPISRVDDIDDIELYYYFWVMPDSWSWHQAVKADLKSSNSTLSQRKLFSWLNCVVSVSVIILILVSGITSNRHPQLSRSYQTFTQKLTTELLDLLPDITH